jgi:glycosyltransferase involved in cell wall biosynthesis
MTASVWSVAREAMRQDADLYHFHDAELLPVGLWLKAHGKAVIYDIHEELSCDISETKPYIPVRLRSIIAWAADRFERSAAGRFSALVGATSAIAEKFSTVNSKTVAVRNFPMTNELYPNTKRPWERRSAAVGFVGGITAQRGLKEIIDALALLPETEPVRLQLAGAFWPDSFREELVQRPGWARVDELGVVDRRGVAELLGRVRAGLITYHAYTNHVRAEPNKLFEYMSAGIPVIASDFPLWRKIVDGVGCGLLVDPADPDAIASAIQYVLLHPAEAEAMGRRGMEAVRTQYNWAQEEQKLLQLYAGLRGSASLEMEPESVQKRAGVNF